MVVTKSDRIPPESHHISIKIVLPQRRMGEDASIHRPPPHTICGPAQTTQYNSSSSSSSNDVYAYVHSGPTSPLESLKDVRQPCFPAFRRGCFASVHAKDGGPRTRNLRARTRHLSLQIRELACLASRMQASRCQRHLNLQARRLVCYGCGEPFAFTVSTTARKL